MAKLQTASAFRTFIIATKRPKVPIVTAENNAHGMGRVTFSLEGRIVLKGTIQEILRRDST